MEIELLPDPPERDPAGVAVRRALEREGLAADPVPAGSVSAWHRAGLEEAMRRDLAPVAAPAPLDRVRRPARRA